MSLLPIVFLLCIGLTFGLPAEYELLKKFREEEDVGTGLFLIDNYPEAVFIDELRVELAEVLTRWGDLYLARKVLSKVNLDNLRESYGDKVVPLWTDLGLDPKAVVLRFPEKVPELVEKVSLSEKEKEVVFGRLLRMRMYDLILSSKKAPCYYRGLALYRKKNYEKAISFLKRCPDRRGLKTVLLAYLRMGKLKKAETFVKRSRDPDLAFLMAKGFIASGKLKKARRFIQRSGFNFRRFFYEGLITFAEGKYRQSYELFSRSLKYTEAPAELSRAHFWIFKSLLKMGVYDLAEYHLKKASEGKGFYSVVAKVYLYKGVDLPPEYVVAHNPSSLLYERLLSIKEGGFDHYFRLEVLKNVELLSAEDLILLRKIDPYIAIKAGLRKYGEDSEFVYFLLYPFPHREAVIRASKDFGIDPALIYAVMKQESLFNERAVSRSFAMGLMQLLERTARWKARRIGYELRDIFSPEDNIYLGTAYLRYLMDLWNGDLVKVLASYNAGQGAVSRWRDYEDSYLFMEMIPYDETRNYVKKVLRNYYIYRQLIK
jgi:soluble lytic murein transglycosylase